MALEPSQLQWPLPFDEIAAWGFGKSLAVWSGRTHFCGACGKATHAVDGGTKKVCGSCGESQYPRVDPVGIALVVSAEGTHCLLGRQPAFPPGYYSCLAGFLESGESIEEGVRREVHEEAGVRLASVRYHASQPWPIGRGMFGQLMIGCTAVAAQTCDVPLAVDASELEDARWYSRAEVKAAVMSHYAPRERAAASGGVASASPSSKVGVNRRFSRSPQLPREYLWRSAAPHACSTATTSAPSLPYTADPYTGDPSPTCYIVAQPRLPVPQIVLTPFVVGVADVRCHCVTRAVGRTVGCRLVAALGSPHSRVYGRPSIAARWRLVAGPTAVGVVVHHLALAGAAVACSHVEKATRHQGGDQRQRVVPARRASPWARPTQALVVRAIVGDAEVGGRGRARRPYKVHLPEASRCGHHTHRTAGAGRGEQDSRLRTGVLRSGARQ
mgnify:CR=1 FL=1